MLFIVTFFDLELEFHLSSRVVTSGGYKIVQASCQEW